MTTRQPSHTRIHLLTSTIFAVFLALALTACGNSTSDSEGGTPPDYSRLTKDSQPALAALYKQGNELLDGGPDAFDARMEELKGHPVVVNAWASWCGPCRAEFPHLQDVSAAMGDQVAFLGVNSSDDAELAQNFLDDNPLPYPSYSDPDRTISDKLGATHGFPATAFYDAEGNLTFTRSGGYTSKEELEADVKTYAIDGGEG